MFSIILMWPLGSFSCVYSNWGPTVIEQGRQNGEKDIERWRKEHDHFLGEVMELWYRIRRWKWGGIRLQCSINQSWKNTIEKET